MKYLDEVLGHIRICYGIEADDICEASRGYYGETWRLSAADAGGGERLYFAKIDYSPAHRDVYRRSFGALERFMECGIDFVNCPIRALDGGVYTLFGEGVFGLFEWIEGESYQDEVTKHEEYRMLGEIYRVPWDGLELPAEDFGTRSAEDFFEWVEFLRTNSRYEELVRLIDSRWDRVLYRSDRLREMSRRCREGLGGDLTAEGYVITHSDSGSNVIIGADKFWLVDWDNPIIAPPERDAWFTAMWGWARELFADSLARAGVKYELRAERLAYYAYHFWFEYLNVYFMTLRDLPDSYGEICGMVEEYFGCWIENCFGFADGV